MSQVDWNSERKRLRDRYAAMEDGELEKIASDAPVMVGRYRDLPDAQVAKSLLDSAGIDSFLGR